MISLTGLSSMSNRQSMKFNIYLNSLKDVSVDRHMDDLTISFRVVESHFIENTVHDLIDHLKKQNCELVVDEKLQQMVATQETRRSDVADTFEQLKAIQANDRSVKSTYDSFCAFCDSALRITLRPYQYKSAFLLSVGKGGFDFSVPGSGKTIITYAAYASMKANGIADSIFVVGPTSSYNAWFDEYMTCFGIEPEFENLSEQDIGTCKTYFAASPKNHKEITFINIEKIRSLAPEISSYLSNHKALLIIDEAHKIKNPNAKATIAALDITKYAQARIVLTGTPMPNGYEDLHSLTKVFSPFLDILPFNYQQLRNMTKDDATQAQAERIRNSIGPYYSRVSKKYLLQKKELLPPQYHVVDCHMDDEQSRLYQRLNEFCGKLTDEIDEDILADLKKAILIRKMQISADPALLFNSIISSMDELREEYADSINKEKSSTDRLITADREVMSNFHDSSITKTINRYGKGEVITAKNRKAVEIASELVSQGKKVLIWDIFVKNMDTLKRLLEKTIDTRVELVNGSVSGPDRQSSLKRFREGTSMILLANPATLAESISLHKVCQDAIYVNRNFNAAQFIQSKDRIHRINMPKGTTANYYFLLNDESVDSIVNDRLDKKEKRMLAILDADEIEVGGAEFEDNNIMSNQDIEESYMR